MKSRIRNQKDLAAGLIYIVAGGAFALGALNYKVGDAARMGPGYFPLAVGLLLAVVGLATVAMAFRSTAAAERLQVPRLGTIAWIIGAVAAFGLLLQPTGLIVSLAVLILMSSMASHEFSWRGALANTVFLILFAVGVFIYGINLQIPLWPSFVR